MARSSWESTAPFFRSAAQVAVLHRLVQHRDEWVDLETLTPRSVGSITARREVLRLVAAGIVDRRTTQRPHRFRLPSDGPITEHLVALLQRTAGVEVVLRTELERMPFVHAAAIHGSWASGAVTPASDVDLLVLVDDTAGGDELEAIYAAGHVASDVIGRDVDIMVFPIGEARARLQSGAGFLHAVVHAPLVDIIGDVDEALAGGRSSA